MEQRGLLSLLPVILATPVLGLAHVTPGHAAPPRKAALENGEYTARINSLKLWYKVSGQGPVCLVPTPGWGPSSDLYFRTLKPLEKSFTVVYFDTRGTGRSERPKAATEYTWAHLVADLDALRAHLKQDRVWMMGHSEGGMQIMHYACRYPNRVRGLILLATMAVVRPADPSLIARVMRRKDEPWFPEAMRRAASAKADATTPNTPRAAGRGCSRARTGGRSSSTPDGRCCRHPSSARDRAGRRRRSRCPRATERRRVSGPVAIACRSFRPSGLPARRSRVDTPGWRHRSDPSPGVAQRNMNSTTD